MQLAVAGHLPPVLALPGRDAELVDTIISAPIGTPWDVVRSSTTIPIDHGAVVAFYTDGLVERRGEVIDVGLERLRRVVKPGPPEEVARDIMRGLIGSTAPRDDVALVVMQRE
jgi:serine phosphatase RsbU (regulator of sigma subunit)